MAASKDRVMISAFESTDRKNRRREALAERLQSRYLSEKKGWIPVICEERIDTQLGWHRLPFGFTCRIADCGGEFLPFDSWAG